MAFNGFNQGYGEGYILELNTAVKKVKKPCPRKVYRPAAMTSALTAMTSFGVEAYFMARNFAKILQTPGYVTKISADVNKFEFGAELGLI